MGKVHSTAGETILETIVAILVVTISVLFLANAIVAAMKANNAIQNESIAFRFDDAEVVGSGAVTYSVEGTDPSKPSPQVATITVYKTNGAEYYYYEKN